MKDWLLSRIKVPSTYKGGSLLISILAIYFGPEVAQQLGGVAITILGIWETIRKEKSITK